MIERITAQIRESIRVKQLLLDQVEMIDKIADVLTKAIKNGGKLLFCGNGGSAADSQHLATELIVRLSSEFERPAIPAIALTTDSSILTACANDYGYNRIFSRQIEALASDKDVLIGISTSGNSANVLQALEVAGRKKMVTVGLTGRDGGKMKGLCNYIIWVDSENPNRIQESHILAGHILCDLIQRRLYDHK